MAELLTIGQVAAEIGVATSTLRYYDELGLIEPATRISGQRRYDPRVLHRLRIVSLCQRAGFSLGEVERLLEGDQDWRQLAEEKLAALDERIRELTQAKRLVRQALACGCASLEGCERAAPHLHPAQDEPAGPAR